MLDQRGDSGTAPRAIANRQDQSRQARMRQVTQAVLALSAWPGGFPAFQLAAQVRDCGEADYQSRPAAYDLKKLRGKKMVRRVSNTRKDEPISTDDRAAGCLVATVTAVSARESDQASACCFDRNAACAWSPASKQPRASLRDHPCRHAGRFSGTGFGCLNIDNCFFGLRPHVPNS
jgi:hypothetical protein